MPERAPDYADKIADQIIANGQIDMTDAHELLAAGARAGYALGLGVIQ